MAGSHCFASRLRNTARLNSGRPSGAHDSGGSAPPLRIASATSGIQRAARDYLGTVERLVADIASIGENRHVPGWQESTRRGQRPSRRIIDLQQPARSLTGDSALVMTCHDTPPPVRD